MGYRSSTCSSRTTGKPLMSYSTEHEASQQAEYSARAHQTTLSPYRCRQCDSWHLAPGKRPPDYCCWCVGRDRQPKRSYTSEQAADEQAKRLPSCQRLRAYECPRGDGWHLTSK